MKESNKNLIPRSLTDQDLVRLSEIIHNKKDSSRWDILRHPLVLLIAGFALSGVLGGVFTSYLKSLEQEKASVLEMEKAAREQGMKATLELSNLLYKRRGATELLASTLKREGTKEELKERKRKYDESYIEWNSHWPAIALRLRKNTDYSNAEAQIQYSIIPRFSKLDSYLTTGYDARLKNKNWKYESKNVKPHLKAILDCSYAVTQNIWVSSKFAGNIPVDIAEEMLKRCQVEDL